MIALLNESIGQHPIERSVEMSGKHGHAATRSLESLHERPAVLFALREGDENAEHEIFQREVRAWVGGHAP